MYSVQFIVMSILQCRVKFVVHWRGGREGSFPEKTGHALLALLIACTMHWCLYSTEFRPEQQALLNSRARKVDQKVLQEQFLCTSGRLCIHLNISL